MRKSFHYGRKSHDKCAATPARNLPPPQETLPGTEQEEERRKGVCANTLCVFLLNGDAVKKPQFSKCCFTLKSRTFASAANVLGCVYTDG